MNDIRLPGKRQLKRLRKAGLLWETVADSDYTPPDDEFDSIGGYTLPALAKGLGDDDMTTGVDEPKRKKKKGSKAARKDALARGVLGQPRAKLSGQACERAAVAVVHRAQIGGQ